MKIVDVKKYVCGVCGNGYDTEVECRACEGSHKMSHVRLSVDTGTGNAVVQIKHMKMPAGTEPFEVGHRTYIKKMSPKNVMLEWDCYVPEEKTDDGKERVGNACQEWFFGNASKALSPVVKEPAVKPVVQKRRPGRPRKNH